MNKLKLFRALFFAAAMWSTNFSFAQGTVTLTYADFLADPNWTVPAGVTLVTVEVWGAGGGGGAGEDGNKSGGGGGGGGGYSKTTDIVVVPAASHAFNVGKGGDGGADGVGGANGSDGEDGGNTDILGVSATGGGGGNCEEDSGNRNGGAAGTGDSNGGAGGNGTASDGAGGGGESGGDGCVGTAGNAGDSGGGTEGDGGAGCADGGDGGNGEQGNDAPGDAGTGPGGGGGGGTDDEGDGDGGNGAHGQIIISWSTTCDPCYSAVDGGNWSADATWSNTSGGAGGYTPTADGGIGNPSYVIENGHTVNVDEDINIDSLTVGTTAGAGAGNGILSWSGNHVMNVNNDGQGAASVIFVKDGSSITRNGNNADIKIATDDDGAESFTFTVNDATTGIDVRKFEIEGGNATVTFGGTGIVTLSDDFEIDENDAIITNNLTGNFTIGDDWRIMGDDNNNLFTNNGTVAITGTMFWDQDADDNTYTNAAGATTTVGEIIDFDDTNTDRDAILNNLGIFTVTDRIDIQQDGVTINNAHAAAVFTVTNDIDIGNDNITINNSVAAGQFILDDFDVDGNGDDNTDVTNVGIMTFVNLNLSDADFDITNTGTIHHNGNFTNGEIVADAAGGSVFTNGLNAFWNYAGTGHDDDTDIRCSADNNTFNYMAGGNQEIIRPDVANAGGTRDDYHDVWFTISGTKAAQAVDGAWTFDVAGDLLISGAAILDVDDAANGQGNNIEIGGNWSNWNTSGFTEGDEDVTFDGTTATQELTNTAGTENFHNFYCAGTQVVSQNDHIDVENDITISNTAILAPDPAKTIDIAGDWLNRASAGFTEGTSVVDFDGAGTQSITTSDGNKENFYDVTFTGSSTVTYNDDLDVENDLTIAGTAVLDAAAAEVIDIAGDWLNRASAGFTETNTTVDFDGAGTQSITTSDGNTENFHNVSFSGSSTVTFNDNLDVENDLTISGTAVLDAAGTETINIAGNWTNRASAGFTEAGTTVTFDGGGAQAINTVDNNTENFNEVVLSGGNTVTINDDVTIAEQLTFSADNSYLDIRGKTLTFTDAGGTDIAGHDNNEFIIVDNTGGISFTGIVAVETLDIPMGTATTEDNYQPAVVVLNNAGAGTFTANMCAVVEGDAACDGGALTEYGVAGMWFFTSTSTDADITLFWDESAGASKELTNFDQADAFVSQWGGAAWGEVQAGAAHGNGAAANGHADLISISGTGVNIGGAGKFAVGSNGGVLPVELISFSASKNNKVVDLTWATGSEINNDYFTIERSLDGITFEQIGVVAGAGNSFSLLNYYANDFTPETRVNYYRIVQTDFDGTQSASSVIAVDMSEGSSETHENHAPSMEVSLYPNPLAGSAFYLSVNNPSEENEVLVVLYDQYGREAYSKVIIISENGHTVSAVDTQGRLKPGVYIVTGSSKQRLFTKRLVVK